MPKIPVLLCLLITIQPIFPDTAMAHAVLNMQSDNNGSGTNIPDKNANISSVVISGMQDQDWKPYKNFLRGLIVFEDKHFLAPATDLSFVLRPQLNNIDMEKVRLRLEGEQTNKHIDLTPNGVFKLLQDPKAAEDNAELTLNQKKKHFLWNIVAIRTPSLQPHQRRMGDLRLTCEVFIAIED